jgi:hypothetical protein
MCATNLAVPILILALFSFLLWSLRDSWVAWGLLLPVIVPFAVFTVSFFNEGCYGEGGIMAMGLAIGSFWVSLAFSVLLSVLMALRKWLGKE